MVDRDQNHKNLVSNLDAVFESPKFVFVDEEARVRRGGKKCDMLWQTWLRVGGQVRPQVRPPTNLPVLWPWRGVKGFGWRR